MAVPYTAAELKARFETGDIPTQQDYADLIDTFFYHIDALYSQGTGVVSNEVKAKSKCTYTVAAGYAGAGNLNIASFATQAANRTRVTWTVPFGNANYKVCVRATNAAGYEPVIITAQTTTHIDLQFAQNIADGLVFHLVVFA